MYKVPKPGRTSLTVNNSVKGETIEQKIERILNNNEAITDGAPTIYTDRKDGVLPEYNIRTDRWDLALEGTDAISKSKFAKREEYLAARDPKPDGGEVAPPDMPQA